MTGWCDSAGPHPAVDWEQLRAVEKGQCSRLSAAAKQTTPACPCCALAMRHGSVAAATAADTLMEITGPGLVGIALTDFVLAAVGTLTPSRYADVRTRPVPACAENTGRASPGVSPVG